MMDIVLQTILGSYERFVGTFGSPVAQVAIAAVLVAVAAADLYFRKRKECQARVR
jgi:hypothetical protein